MGDYIFIMSESDFRVKTVSAAKGSDWTFGYHMYHCGFIVCKSVHNSALGMGTQQYWSHRNQWLAGNAEAKVMAYSYYENHNDAWS